MATNVPLAVEFLVSVVFLLAVVVMSIAAVSLGTSMVCRRKRRFVVVGGGAGWEGVCVVVGGSGSDKQQAFVSASRCVVVGGSDEQQAFISASVCRRRHALLFWWCCIGMYWHWCGGNGAVLMVALMISISIPFVVVFAVSALNCSRSAACRYFEFFLPDAYCISTSAYRVTQHPELLVDGVCVPRG